MDNAIKDICKVFGIDIEEQSSLQYEFSGLILDETGSEYVTAFSVR